MQIHQMCTKLSNPNFTTSLPTLLQGHCSQSHLFQIHARVFRFGAHQDDLIATRLIGRYPIRLALRVFYQMQSPNLFPFNAIIRVVAEEKSQSSLALSFFRLLKQQSLSPNDLTFSFLLKACFHSRNWMHVSQIHNEAIKLGYFGDSAVCNALLSVYAKGLKDMNSAHKVFDEMPEKSVVSCWTSLIDVYAKCGKSEAALQLFLMMVNENVKPDSETMVSVLAACAKLYRNDIEKWVSMFTDIIESGDLISDVHDSVNTVLTYLYGKWGNVEKSRDVFDRIGDVGKRNVVTWNAMIGAYVQNGYAVEALDLYRVMIDYPYIAPNHVTLVSVLSACSQVGDIDLGISVHEYINSHGRKDILRTNSFLATALVDMYCKCGNLERAKSIFHSIHSKDVISINVMIMGLAVNGEGHEALKLFTDMLELGFHPNGGTFLGVLCACSHSGLLNVGLNLFQDMKTKFRIPPQLEHYACYIDLLARVGKIEEALEVAKSMPFKPNSFVWGALLGGCLVHFKGKLTQEISRKLIEVDPENSGGYVMLSNALAGGCDWGNISSLRQLMKDKGVKKHRGCSWISVEGVVHEFVAGPCTRSQVSSITEMLDGLRKEMALPS